MHSVGNVNRLFVSVCIAHFKCVLNRGTGCLFPLWLIKCLSVYLYLLLMESKLADTKDVEAESLRDRLADQLVRKTVEPDMSSQLQATLLFILKKIQMYWCTTFYWLHTFSHLFRQLLLFFLKMPFSEHGLHGTPLCLHLFPSGVETIQ